MSTDKPMSILLIEDNETEVVNFREYIKSKKSKKSKFKKGIKVFLLICLFELCF